MEIVSDVKMETDLGAPRHLHALSQKIVPFSIQSKLLSASHYLVGSGMNICSGQSQT